ncbi:unnamed protein product [Bursaphelenchus okinawaensis]|uniref:RING-type domain-containing protein n=1 Tax=Bursaphelenchus okinawaensis TaxID=465554 RepID=A0A811KUG7_9BILA|nr:unnamed protein product [Bursaphelenchus okinawaensis]CAG9112214.1 unnamed protein product [Bursaphelenchus okinawaensis]
MAHSTKEFDTSLWWYDDEEGAVCCICMDPPEVSAICMKCNQMVGCEGCVRLWHKTQMSDGTYPDCPLCRASWRILDRSIKICRS